MPPGLIAAYTFARQRRCERPSFLSALHISHAAPTQGAIAGLVACGVSDSNAASLRVAISATLPRGVSPSRSAGGAVPQSSCQNGGVRGLRERESELRGGARANVRGRAALHESVIHGRGRLRHGRVSVHRVTAARPLDWLGSIAGRFSLV